MAGDWIKWEKGLIRKPEVLQLADLMGWSVYETAARCMVFWEWLDEASRSRNVPGVTRAHIDALVGAQKFAESMEQVGWLRVTREGLITIPNYERHNSKSAKRRALASQRAVTFRSRSRNARVTLKSAPEKRREEIREPPPPPAGAGGDARRPRRTTRADRKAAAEQRAADNRRAVAEYQAIPLADRRRLTAEVCRGDEHGAYSNPGGEPRVAVMRKVLAKYAAERTEQT